MSNKSKVPPDGGQIKKKRASRRPDGPYNSSWGQSARKGWNGMYTSRQKILLEHYNTVVCASNRFMAAEVAVKRGWASSVKDAEANAAIRNELKYLHKSGALYHPSGTVGDGVSAITDTGRQRLSQGFKIRKGKPC